MKELQYLNSYFIKYKFHFIGGIIITIIAQIFMLYTPELVGDSISEIEKFVKTKPKNTILIKSILLKNILWIIVTTIIAGILTFLMRQTLIVMSRHVEFDLKNEVYNKYQVLSQNFYKNNRTGDLMNRISEDVGRVRMYVGPAVMYTINTFIRFGIVIYYMITVSPKLTLYSLLPLPILAYFIFKISTEINKRSTVFQENLSQLSSFSQEIFSGIRVVKAYDIEEKKQIEFEKLSNESKTKNLSLAKISALFGPLMLLLIGLSNLIVIFIGGSMYINGSIADIGVIAKFILYINMLVWPVASIGWVSSLIQEAEASQKRINEFLKIELEIQSGLTKIETFKSKIEFKNVSLIYEDTKIKALTNLNFIINKGETIAILGRTGSGKSTLINLISRLFDTTSGSIEIDGKNIQEFELNSLRNLSTQVPQDAFLFSDTIKNNIKFGNQNATDLQVQQAAKYADVHNNIIEFKDQYETILGERGITLSGGQKQRVSIARALLKNSEIILLDDCLSAVDTETEEIILNNLEKIAKNKTVIIVSHRISSVKNADRIFIIDNGQIIEQGSHNQLVNQNGTYKEMFLKQLSEKEM